MPADVHRAQRRVLLGVEQGLADVQGGGGGGGHGPRDGTGDDVGPRVVVPAGVDLLLHELVGDEVNGLEGDVHGELGGVAAVEGTESLRPLHCPDAGQDGLVGRVEHLHPLLHHWPRDRQHRAGQTRGHNDS